MKNLRKVFYNYVSRNMERGRGDKDSLYFSRMLMKFSIYGILLSVFFLLFFMSINLKKIAAVISLAVGGFTFFYLFLLSEYQRIEKIRDNIEKMYFSMLRNFIRNLNVLPNQYYTDDLRALEKKVIKRFLRTLRKAEFQPKEPGDFKFFDFTDEKFVNNSSYTILVEDIKDFIKNDFCKVESETETTKESIALAYFGLNQFNIDLIKKAFKNKLKTVHPDNGGSEEEFCKAKEFYDYLLSL